MSVLPLTTIVVVNYNGGSELRECLESILQQTKAPYELVVVDNASTDGSLDAIREGRPWLQVVRNKQNLGYSAAINQGLQLAEGKYVAVLNMDIVVEQGWLGTLVQFLEDTPLVGAVNPLLLTYQEPDKINALGQIVQWSGLGFNRKLGWPRAKADRVPVRISGLQGGAFVFRTDLLRRIGGMNEACFLYHEDVDLSWVTYLAGFELYAVPDAVVYHRYTLKLTPGKLQLLERNRWTMLLANLKTRTLLLLLPYLAAIELLIWVYCLFQGKGFLKAKLESVRQVWRRWDVVQERRRFVGRLRVRSDAALLKVMHPLLVWDQVVGLLVNPASPQVGWLSKFGGG